MSKSPKIVIVISRCQATHQIYGIRMEEKKSGHWYMGWAFTINEKQATREGYDRTQIKGDFNSDPEYPGCPDCNSKSLFLCSCEKLTCWNGSSNKITCAWCGLTATAGRAVDSLNVGRDL